jgi:hypothetical protein
MCIRRCELRVDAGPGFTNKDVKQRYTHPEDYNTRRW